MNNINRYNGLELPLIQKIVADYASFSLSKKYILNEEVSFNPIIIKQNLKKTKEALDLIFKHGRYRFDDISDITQELEHVKKGYTLTSKELYEVLIHNTQIKRIIRYFKQLQELDTLNDYTESLFYSDNIINLINSKINDNGEVKKDASLKLKTLYENLSSIELEINEKAHLFLRDNVNSVQESVIYYRNNRACFLIKNSDKNKFNGFQYGSSASGQAFYVEPQILVNLNNRKGNIENDIASEIDEILMNLSLEVYKYSDNYLDNLDSIMKLDAIMAKAFYGYENAGVIACIDDYLLIKDVAHPLIDKEKVVLNTYRIIKPHQSIIISGSNTGGKTVSLKAIGLSVLMSYLGIPLIASEAHIPLYNYIFDDINDVQSIQESLSTFSSRLVSLNKMLNRADYKSLVLIDEIASGTDPKEGEALAIAIIEALLNKGVTFVITTHFDAIKRYALSQDRILLSSQEFDPIKLLPTYRYLENTLGQSNALDIAYRYLDNRDILKRAKIILKEKENTEEKLIRQLEYEKKQVIIEKDKLNNLIKEQEILKKDYDNRIKLLKQNEEKIKADAELKIELFIEEQKQLAKNILKEIKDKNIKYHEAVNLINKLDDLNKTSDNDEQVDETININDTVKIHSTGQVGKVIEMKKDKVTVEVNGISLKTSLNNLEKTVAPKEVKKKHVDKTYKRVDKEILLVGKRCEEALDLLSKYLDEAYGSNLSSVKVIHGIGTGVLKKAIWEFLKKSKIVKSYHHGDAYDGGSNVTIVEFK